MCTLLHHKPYQNLLYDDEAIQNDSLEGQRKPQSHVRLVPSNSSISLWIMKPKMSLHGGKHTHMAVRLYLALCPLAPSEYTFMAMNCYYREFAYSPMELLFPGTSNELTALVRWRLGRSFVVQGTMKHTEDMSVGPGGKPRITMMKWNFCICVILRQNT